jgi:hypothetical protein
MTDAAAPAGRAPAVEPTAENGDGLLKEHWPNSMPPIDGVVEVMVGDRPCRCRRRDLERATVYSNATKMINFRGNLEQVHGLVTKVLEMAKEQDLRITRLEAIVDTLLRRSPQDPHPEIEKSAPEDA